MKTYGNKKVLLRERKRYTYRIPIPGGGGGVYPRRQYDGGTPVLTWLGSTILGYCHPDLGPVTGVPPGKDMRLVEVLWGGYGYGDGVTSPPVQEVRVSAGQVPEGTIVISSSYFTFVPQSCDEPPQEVMVTTGQVPEGAIVTSSSYLTFVPQGCDEPPQDVMVTTGQVLGVPLSPHLPVLHLYLRLVMTLKR